MRQRIFVDRLAGAVYLGLALCACAGQPGALVPVDVPVATRAEVGQWVSATTPPEQRLYRFKWLFQDERSSAGGRGTARIAPPDSLRFDVAGPFGSGQASAAVVADRPLWVQPPDAVRKLVPDYSLLWAMFGIARMPADTDGLRGLGRPGEVAWRYTAGADTIDYLRTMGTRPTLLSEVRHAGTIVGRAETSLAPDGAPLSARLVVPSVPAKLSLTFLSTARTAIASDLWSPPHRP